MPEPVLRYTPAGAWHGAPALELSIAPSGAAQLALLDPGRLERRAHAEVGLYRLALPAARYLELVAAFAGVRAQPTTDRPLPADTPCYTIQLGVDLLSIAHSEPPRAGAEELQAALDALVAELAAHRFATVAVGASGRVLPAPSGCHLELTLRLECTGPRSVELVNPHRLREGDLRLELTAARAPGEGIALVPVDAAKVSGVDLGGRQLADLRQPTLLVKPRPYPIHHATACIDIPIPPGLRTTGGERLTGRCLSTVVWSGFVASFDQGDEALARGGSITLAGPDVELGGR
jgi:hypothetical protein